MEFKNECVFKQTFLLIIFAVLIIFPRDGSSKHCTINPLDSTHVLINKKIPDFLRVTLDGDTISHKNLSGYVTLFQFMYFACRPCMEELSYFNKLNEKYKNQKLKIVAIIPNRVGDIRIYQENKDTTSIFCFYRRLMKYEDIQYTILSECKNENTKLKKNELSPDCNDLSEIFYKYAYPANYLIDKNGIIRYVYEGFPANNQEESIALIEADIQKLLKEK